MQAPTTCPDCRNPVHDGECTRCDWVYDARVGRENEWDRLTKRQDTAKERIWRVLVKAREKSWPQAKRDAEVKRLLEYADICLSCQHGIVVMERHHPVLERVAKRKGWDPIRKPVEQRAALCDHEDERTGRKCELGSFRADVQKESWGRNQTRSAAEKHRWEVSRGPGKKADGTVRQEVSEDERLQALGDYEIDLRAPA